jgi:hypothetical protein
MRLRQGAVGSVQAGAHGEDLAGAAGTGAITAGLGMPFNVAGELAGGLAKQAEAANQETQIAGQTSRVGSKVLDVPKPTDAQESLQGGLRKTASDATSDATGRKINFKSGSMRDTFSHASEAVMNKSKSLFNQIDKATSNGFQPVQNALKENTMAMRAATSEEEVLGLMKDRLKLEQQEQIFAEAQKAGVDKKTVETARATYKQASALEDLNKQVEFSVSGTRPEIAGKFPSQIFNPETVDAGKFSDRLNKMYNANRLQEALGKQQAKDVIALSDQMKENPDAMRSYTAFVSKAILNKPLTTGKKLAVSTAKDLWGSPTATHVAILALHSGVSAEKAVPAILNAAQVELGKP